MCVVSILIVTFNSEETISEAIESVLNQSFKNFELIIVNDDSTDCIRSIVNAFKDKRIHLIDNKRNYALSLNMGLRASTGKYIVRMDANDLMHVDCLKILFAIMEAYPDITVSSSNLTLFGEKIPKRYIEQQTQGIVETPLLHLLLDDKLLNFAYIIRSSFIIEHHLLFENYPYAEDYKFLTEIAKMNGVFYAEHQSLFYSRVNNMKISRERRWKILQSSLKIKREITSSLCNQNKDQYPALTLLNNAFNELSNQKLISKNEVFQFFHYLFMKKNNVLSINNVPPKVIIPTL